MKFVLPDFLEKNHTLNKLENLSICKYIQYEEERLNKERENEYDKEMY